ncbi:MAG: DUF805 domain-containing protein [Chitinophagaceae bacterium]|nr:DUF805 domain-containing protein [Chitinophagaceae bacterium]
MFKAPFSFEGRIRRKEYGLSYLIYFVIAFSISLLLQETGEIVPIFLMFAFIPLLWFMWAQGAKRCHDIGRSGWYQLIPFYIFWMLLADSHAEINEYGPNPKNLHQINEIDEIGDELVK